MTGARSSSDKSVSPAWSWATMRCRLRFRRVSYAASLPTGRRRPLLRQLQTRDALRADQHPRSAAPDRRGQWVQGAGVGRSLTDGDTERLDMAGPERVRLAVGTVPGRPRCLNEWSRGRPIPPIPPRGHAMRIWRVSPRGLSALLHHPRCGTSAAINRGTSGAHFGSRAAAGQPSGNRACVPRNLSLDSCSEVRSLTSEWVNCPAVNCCALRWRGC